MNELNHIALSWMEMADGENKEKEIEISHLKGVDTIKKL